MTQRRFAASNNGQLIGVKTLLYLVLAVAVVLLAVILLVKIYNAFIGGSPSQQDADLLASTINDMLRDNRPYIQTPMLIRLDGDRIVGFDPQARSVDIPKAGWKTSDPIGQRSDQIAYSSCGTRACVCSSTGKGINKCYNLDVPTKGSLRLRANYQGYPESLPVKNDVDSLFTTLPKDIKGSYSDFVIDKEATKFFGVSNKAMPNSPNAILPVIIEKVVGADGNTVIIVSPDSSQVRGREYYLYQCPKGQGDATCDGQTGVSSRGDSGDTYCAHSLSQPGCFRQTISVCGVFCGVATEPCLCDASSDDPNKHGVATYGYCSKAPKAHIVTNCGVVRTCADYCNQDGAKGCTSTELTTCSFDVCHVAQIGQTCKAGLDASTDTTTVKGIWDVTRAVFDDSVYDEKCIPSPNFGAAAQDRARIEQACST